jgi:hypothetical protein
VNDAFDADQTIGDGLDLPGRTFDNQYFQAIVLVKMDMAAAENMAVMFVLEVN